MKLKFKSLSMALAVVLFFGITLTPITANAAMKNKKMKVYLTVPNTVDSGVTRETYSRWNSSRTSKNFIGAAKGFGTMVTISSEHNIYYNANSKTSTTTNYIRKVTGEGTEFCNIDNPDWYKFTYTADDIEKHKNMRITIDSSGKISVKFDNWFW